MPEDTNQAGRLIAVGVGAVLAIGSTIWAGALIDDWGQHDGTSVFPWVGAILLWGTALVGFYLTHYGTKPQSESLPPDQIAHRDEA